MFQQVLLRPSEYSVLAVPNLIGFRRPGGR